jgi:arylamine N-acetyltransferase
MERDRVVLTAGALLRSPRPGRVRVRAEAAGPQGRRSQVVELIDELIGAHVHAICFENLDVVAARVRGEVRAVSVSPDEVADKLLDDGRGGYCHEHAVLIRTALAELGLAVHPVLARVHLGAGRAEPGGLTHQATIVELGALSGTSWIRVSAEGLPNCALPLTGGARATVRGEHRIVPAESVLEPADARRGRMGPAVPNRR